MTTLWLFAYHARRTVGDHAGRSRTAFFDFLCRSQMLTASDNPTSATRHKSDRFSVAILSSAFNRAFFLREQLASLINQTHTNRVLRASDDGSIKATREILEQHGQCLPPGLLLAEGLCKGIDWNFMSLASNYSLSASVPKMHRSRTQLVEDWTDAIRGANQND